MTSMRSVSLVQRLGQTPRRLRASALTTPFQQRQYASGNGAPYNISESAGDKRLPYFDVSEKVFVVTGAGGCFQ